MKPKRIISPWIASTDHNLSAQIDNYYQTVMKFSLALIVIWLGLVKPSDVSPEEELTK